MNLKKVNSVTYAAMAFLGIYMTLYQRMLDVIADDLTLNKVSMALLVTVHFIGFLISPIVAGELSDKYGRRSIISASYVVLLIGIIFIILSVNIYFLEIGIFLVGAGVGVIEGTLTTLLSDLNFGNENRVINISQLYFTLGAVVGPFIVVAFLNFIDSWKLIYIIFIIPFIYLFLFYKNSNYSDKKLEDRIQGTIVTRLIKNKIFLLLSACMIMYVGIEQGIAFWITSYMKEMVVSEWLPTIALSVFWLSMSVGRYLISRYQQKLIELIFVSSIFSGLFIILAILFNNYIFNIICFAGIGFGFAGIWPIIMVITGEVYSKYKGTAFGIMMACGALGGSIVPYIMGLIGELYNMKVALAFTMLPILIIIFNFLIISRQKHKSI